MFLIVCVLIAGFYDLSNDQTLMNQNKFECVIQQN